MFCNIFSNAGTQTEDILTTMRPLSVMSGGEQSTPYKTSGSHVTVSSSPGNKVIITFESLVYLNYFIYYMYFLLNLYVVMPSTPTTYGMRLRSSRRGLDESQQDSSPLSFRSVKFYTSIAYSAFHLHFLLAKFP